MCFKGNQTLVICPAAVGDLVTGIYVQSESVTNGLKCIRVAVGLSCMVQIAEDLCKTATM